MIIFYCFLPILYVAQSKVISLFAAKLVGLFPLPAAILFFPRSFASRLI